MKLLIKHCKRSLLIASWCLALLMIPTVQAVEIAGVKMDENIKLANTDLKLNGAGIRFKSIFKVYVMGLYLAEKKTTVNDILNAPGPKQIRLVMLRGLARSGAACVLYSSDTEELVGLCDRVAVFHDGVPAMMLEGDEVTQDAVVAGSFAVGRETAAGASR